MRFYDLDVFINAPFDDQYKPLFDAIVFAVVRYGFRVRCALEADNAAENRFQKICNIIAECRLGIHDISRTEANETSRLPRFNMPLELGLFLGAKQYGGGKQRTKSCIILDREKYRYQQFISDLSGHDIHAHDGEPRKAIQEVTAWLRSVRSEAVPPGGGGAVWSEYLSFRRDLKTVCLADKIQEEELTFPDYHSLVVKHVAAL